MNEERCCAKKASIRRSHRMAIEARWDDREKGNVKEGGPERVEQRQSRRQKVR